MASLEERFPVKISFNAIGGPGFNTPIAEVESGVESRNQAWLYERGVWEVAHAARLPAAWRPLQAFFRIAAGRANTFRFKDWLDYTVSAAEGKFITIDSTHAQLAKRYTFGAVTYDRPIVKPIQTVTFTGGTGLSLDYATGILTHGGLPSDWSGQFDVHARFGTDQMKAETINKQGSGEFIVGWASIPIIEVR